MGADAAGGELGIRPTATTAQQARLGPSPCARTLPCYAPFRGARASSCFSCAVSALHAAASSCFSASLRMTLTLSFCSCACLARRLAVVASPCFSAASSLPTWWSGVWGDLCVHGPAAVLHCMPAPCHAPVACPVDSRTLPLPRQPSKNLLQACLDDEAALAGQGRGQPALELRMLLGRRRRRSLVPVRQGWASGLASETPAGPRSRSGARRFPYGHPRVDGRPGQEGRSAGQAGRPGAGPGRGIPAPLRPRPDHELGVVGPPSTQTGQL